MTNENVILISRAINEICDSLNIKAELKDVYSVIYAANKTRMKIATALDAFSKEEKQLLDAYHSALPMATTEDEKKKLLNQLTEDKQKLFDKEVNVEIHKISPEASPVIVKYLSAQSTFTYLEFLTDEK